MDLVCYSTTTTSSDFRVHSVLGSLPEIRGVDVFSSLRELAKRLLYAGYENTMILFMAGNNEELLDIFSISNLFRKFRTVLILPNREPGTLKIGSLLEPQFISYMDSDFSDIRAVVSHMCTNADNSLSDGGPFMTQDEFKEKCGLEIELRSGLDRRKFHDTILAGMDRRTRAERRAGWGANDGRGVHHPVNKEREI